MKGLSILQVSCGEERRPQHYGPTGIPVLAARNDVLNIMALPESLFLRRGTTSSTLWLYRNPYSCGEERRPQHYGSTGIPILAARNDVLNIMALPESLFLRRGAAIKLRAFPLRRRPATCSRDPALIS